MKKKIILFICYVTIVFLFVSCGKSTNDVSNAFLGKLPSIEKKYADLLDEKEKEIEKCTDMKEAYKLAKEKKLLNKEKEKAIAEYVSAHPLNKDLPFQSLPDTKYNIKKVVVNKASSSNLNIKFLITINEDIKSKYGSIEKTLFIYFKALDSKGNYLPKSTTVATNFKTIKLVAETEYEAFGSWQNKATRNMEDFAKIVEVTRDEWEQNKRK
ncbi:MAG: hypothetical protein K8R79_03040 [Calditrichales bacterium]|nr:hypothetical protein [Calditrichales bacterium]